jgi:hypothetical protein
MFNNTAATVTMASNVTDVWTNVTPSSVNVHMFCDSAVHDHFPHGFAIFIIIWLALIFLADITGNLLVIVVIIKNPSMRDASQTTNYFLLNLAIADLLVSFVIPFSIVSVYQECWSMSIAFCKINSFLVTLSLLTSIHTLMYISIHKFISVRRVAVKNDFNDPVTSRTCFIMIGFAWLWAVIFSIVTVISEPIFKEKTLQCGPRYPIPGRMSFYLHIANQVGNLLIPLAILMFCYIMIFKYIRRHTRDQRRVSLTPTDASQHQGEKGVTLTMFIVLACFILCWFPYVVYTNYAAIVSDKKNDIPYYLNPLVCTISDFMYHAGVDPKNSPGFHRFWFLEVVDAASNCVTVTSYLTNVLKKEIVPTSTSTLPWIRHCYY